MRKSRQIMRKDWPMLRGSIAQSRENLGLGDQDFKELGHDTWKMVYAKILETFCTNIEPHHYPVWLWENFKQPTASMRCPGYIEPLIPKLINDESYYLIVDETIHERTKFWFYEGKPFAISQVLQECIGLYEWYIVEKKYKKLLAFNHHDVLFLLGFTQKETDNTKSLISTYFD